MIVLDNISFSYRKSKPVLSDLSLKIESGSIAGLLGRNGVGKSTMLYLIAGLLKPQTGAVDCNGFTPFNREVPFLNDIFIVPEEFKLPSMGLNEYVKVNAPFYPRFSEETLDKLLEIFGMSRDINLGALSMGQKKKVFLSFAMACDTSILLLDEPTNGLDISSKRAFRMAISSIMDDRKTIVISTHQVYDVEQILDHIVIADTNSILLNQSMAYITSKLRFSYTYDSDRARQAMFSLPIPGGFSIVEEVTDPDHETDVNLEAIFEMTQQQPDQVKRIFQQPEETKE